MKVGVEHAEEGCRHLVLAVLSPTSTSRAMDDTPGAPDGSAGGNKQDVKSDKALNEEADESPSPLLELLSADSDWFLRANFAATVVAA